MSDGTMEDEAEGGGGDEAPELPRSIGEQTAPIPIHWLVDPSYDDSARAPGETPEAKLVATTLIRTFNQIEFRLVGLRNPIEAEWRRSEPESGLADCVRSEREALLVELDGVLDLVAELKDAMARWFGHLGWSHVIEFRLDSWERMKELMRDSGDRVSPAEIAEAGVSLLLDQADPIGCLARYERKRAARTMRIGAAEDEAPAEDTSSDQGDAALKDEA